MKKLLLIIPIAVLLCGCGERKKKQADDAVQVQAPENAAEAAGPPMLKKYDMPAVPMHIQDNAQRMVYMADHYWDKFDFADERYIRSEVAEQAFANYLMLLGSLPSMEAIKKSVSAMMEKASASNDMFKYFSRTCEKYLDDPNSPYRNEEIYIAVLESVLANDKLDPVDKIRPQAQLEMALKNRPGHKANDFAFTTAQGSKGTLYGIRADFTLVFFYNLGCSACKETREGLLKVMKDPMLADMVADGRLKVLAIYPDEDMTEWDKYLGDIPAQWTNAYDEGQVIKENEVYELRAIPSLYLLGKDKTVILKDFTDPAMLLQAVYANQAD